MNFNFKYTFYLKLNFIGYYKIQNTKMKKNVSFSENVIQYTTYSFEEYDRSSIDHLLYRKAYNKITDEEFSKVFVLLDLYKLYDMPVHNDSLKNNNYSSFKMNCQQNPRYNI
jgi:hypothetical protein